MKYELRSVGLWSAFKVLFLFNLIAGFVVGLIYALMFSFIMAIAAQMPGMPMDEFQSMGTSTGVLVIILPILFSLGSAVFNTIIGFIAALLYNAIARLVGGVELDLKVDSAEHAEVTATRATTMGPAGHSAAAPGAPPHQHTPPPPSPSRPEPPVEPPSQESSPHTPPTEPPPHRRDNDNKPDQSV